MKRTAGLLWLGAILTAMSVQPVEAVAQANGSASETQTIWDGVYSVTQAQRGKEIAEVNCIACHSQAEWGSPSFMTRWAGSSVAHLHVHIRDNMPYDGPGRLTAQEYADIVAYMLSLNSVPVGEKELPASVNELDKIQFTAQAP